MSLRVDAQNNWPEAWHKDKWAEIASCLAAAPSDSGLRLLILAAHPDDEIIGASQLLSRHPHSLVCFLTDGAPRDRNLWSPAAAQGSRKDYARIREAEAIKALSIAGVSQANIHWLGGVDQEAALEIATLTRRFSQFLSIQKPAPVITHSYEGGHPDHDSAALVANLAISMLGERSRPLLLEMTSYHAKAGRCVTGEFLNPNTTPELMFSLDRDARERKRRMMDAYSSQRLVLESFPLDQERLRLAPSYDFSQPPHEGQLWYECMGWPMTGERWRELAHAAMLEVQEPSCR